MGLITKRQEITKIDITGANGNAICIATHLGQIMGSEKARKFVTSVKYTTSVAKLCHVFNGYGIDIVHELSAEEITEVEREIAKLEAQDKLEEEKDHSYQVLFTENALRPVLEI